MSDYLLGTDILGAAYTDRASVLLFQTAVLALDSKDPDLHLGARMWPPTDAERARIVDGVLGANTRRAARKWNASYMGRPDLGDAITDETLASLPKVDAIPRVAPEAPSVPRSKAAPAPAPASASPMVAPLVPTSSALTALESSREQAPPAASFLQRALWEGGPVKVWHAFGAAGAAVLALGVGLTIARR